MRLTSVIFERLPQIWVLVGLLIIVSGLFLGFDYSLVFVYLGIGIISFVYGLVLFALLLIEGTKKSKSKPLSRDFISIGPTVMMPKSQSDQEPTSN